MTLTDSVSPVIRLARSPLVLALVIFSLALLPRTLNLGVFVGPDEFYWARGSANFTQALAQADWAGTYHTGTPGVTLMWVETIGAWTRYGSSWLAGQPNWEAAVGLNDDMSTLAAKRQVAGLVNALIVAGIVLLTRRVFGSTVAWLTGILLIFDPFLLTESRAVRTEGLLAGLNTLALLVMLQYLQEPRLRYGGWAGLFTGLALLSKVTGLALLPVGLVALGGKTLFERTWPRSARWRQAGWVLLVWGGVAGLTVLVLWPALWVTPVEVMQQIFGFVFVRAVEGEGGGHTFFLGQTYPAEDDPGPLFYPVVLLYRTGPLLWLGLTLLAPAWLTRRISRREKVAVGLMVLYLAAHLALITLTDLKFDRYTIPMLPTLMIMAALGLAAAWRAITGYQPSAYRWAWLPAGLILAMQLALAMPHHPYYYTYWNPLLGGLKQAVKVLPVGVGGEGIDQVAAYLNTLPEPGKLKLASANSQKIRPLFQGQTIALDNLNGEWVQADLAFIYISQLQRGKNDQNIVDYLRRAPLLHSVTLHGLEYAWIYRAPAAQFYGGGHKLEGRGTLFGYSLCELGAACERGDQSQGVEIPAGETLPVTLYWRNEGQQPDDLFFVRLMDLDGYIWAEAMAQPRPGFEEAARQENAIVDSEAGLKLPVGMPPGDYFFKPGFRTAAGEIIGYFELPADTKPIKVTPAQNYPNPDAFQAPRPASLTANHDLTLLGYQLDPASVQPGADLWLTLYWQAPAAVTHDYVILLRLLAQTGAELSYWLGRPVRSGYPTVEWQAGQMVQDPWRLTIPPEAQPGDYDLEIALFDAATEKEVARQKLGLLTILSK